jgi:hypothetical protein
MGSIWAKSEKPVMAHDSPAIKNEAVSMSGDKE